MDLELSASLPALYAGLPFPAACAAAAGDGFRYVETWAAPAQPDVAGALRALADHGLSLASVNSSTGDAPSFGLAADVTTVPAWRAEFGQTLDFARRASAGAVNVLAGGRVAGQTRSGQLACLRANLEWAAGQLGPDDPLLLLEPLNGADRGSPVLCRLDDALEVLRQLPADRVRLLFDAYHVHQEEPDLLRAFERVAPRVGHVQVADFPGRGEPGTGELAWPEFLSLLRRSCYRGRVGCEFTPTDAAAVRVARAGLARALLPATADAS